MSQKPKLVLLDAHALIHRSYHALPKTFANKKGEPTNAVYGFTSVLLKVLRELKPQYVIAAFDTDKPTFRDELFAEYKAQRPVTADDLSSQIPKVKQILAAFDIAVLEKDGFEADDILGTLVAQLHEQCRIIIVTGDLDTLQLVQPNVEVYTLKKGVTETTIYNETTVQKRFGIKPEQMTDFKGLKGDPSDNIPGVPGIGEKTATEILQKFGNLEEVYKNLESGKTKGLKPALVQKLLDNKEAAFFSKKLATIRLDVPVEVKLQELAWEPAARQENIAQMFQEMGFYTLLERFQQELGSKPEAAEQATAPNAETLDLKNKAEWLKLLTTAKELAVMSSDQGMFVSPGLDQCVLVKPAMMPELSSVIANAQIKKIGYDLKTVWHRFNKTGVFLQGLSFDVMLAAYLLSPGRREYPLERIVFGHLGPAVPLVLASQQTNAVWRLKDILERKLTETELKQVFQTIEMPLIQVLAEMELTGIKIDAKTLKQLAGETQTKIENLEKKIYELAGTEFKINSPAQLKKVLFEKLQLKIKGLRKTAGGVISTRASELDKLKGQHEIIDLILEYRELAKLKNTYLDPLPALVDSKTSRLHTTFNQGGAATGRLSSSEPNLQNIPMRSDLAAAIRSAFVAEKGWQLVSFDYSQLELRIAAALAQDSKMTQAFIESKDIHALTAAEIFNVPINMVTPEMRRTAKTLNFGVLYGMGPTSFSQTAEVSKEDARKFIEEYFKDFSGVAQYIQEIKDEARRNGFVRTLTGRRRYLPEIHGPNDMLVAQAERMAVNMPIQGTEADMMKLAMIGVHSYIRENDLVDSVSMLLTVHDELLLEIRKEKIEAVALPVKQIMETVLKLSVPIKVDVKVGENWGTMKSL